MTDEDIALAYWYACVALADTPCRETHADFIDAGNDLAWCIERLGPVEIEVDGEPFRFSLNRHGQIREGFALTSSLATRFSRLESSP